MPVSYATVADYWAVRGKTKPDEFTPAQEQELDAQLRRASTTVRLAAQFGRYRVGSDAKPADDLVRQAFRDATVYVVEATRPDDNATESEWDSISLLDVSFSRNAGTVAERKAAAASDGSLPAAAAEALEASGIFRGARYPGRAG